MQLCDDIKLDLIHDDDKAGRPSCQLHFKSVATDTTLKGAILEACLECDGRYLLFVTDDIPYEEYLFVYLLDANLNTLDSASLGSPYSTGHFRDLRLLSTRMVGFQFIGRTDWTLEAFQQAKWRVPFFGDSKGVLHKFGFKRHFIVRGNPLPEQRTLKDQGK